MSGAGAAASSEAEFSFMADWSSFRPAGALSAAGMLSHWNWNVTIAPVKVSPVLFPLPEVNLEARGEAGTVPSPAGETSGVPSTAEAAL